MVGRVRQGGNPPSLVSLSGARVLYGRRMFGMSFTELIIIGLLAMFLFGPDRMPEAAKTIGKTLRDLKKATDGLKDQVQRELLDTERSIDQAIKAPDVPPVASAAMAATGAAVRPTLPVAPAVPGNVPGLDAALIETAAPPLPPASPPAASGPDTTTHA
jgi:TatA/E family protein of Tat protein translocase